MRKEAKILENCFGRHSRSNMYFSLVIMIGHGLLLRSDVTEFSEELRLQLNRSFDERGIS